MPDPIRAGDSPTPLPSHVLAGQGIAAFVLTPVDLDRLATLTEYPPTGCDAEQGVYRREVEEQTARAERAEAELARRSREGKAQVDRLVDTNDELRGELRDARALARQRLDEANRLRDERDEARRFAVRPTRHPPVELHVTGAGTVTCDGRELLVEYEVARATTTQTGEPIGEVVELYRDGDACPNPDCSKLAHRGPCSEDMPGLDEDPRRPRLDWYPDDGVTLSYAELRQLLALHLDRCPGAPDLARAMRDGESPLHLAEVIDR